MKRNYRIPRDGTAVAIDVASGERATGEHRRFAIATAHDVVNGALILDPELSRHEEV